MGGGKMYCYLWSDIAHPEECKFGEKFVNVGFDPTKECIARVRSQLGTQKGRFDDSSVILHEIWDVSQVAEAVGRNHAHAAMDNFLRDQIGHVKKGTYKEVHALPWQDMKLRVNRLLAKLGQPLVTASLSTMQYKVAEEVLGFYLGGSKVVLASLCARFGKTIWSSAVALELDVQIVVVASYVKTVFTSFASDITKFQQFADYVHIDAADEDAQDQLEAALAAGKRAFIYLSMANGSKRQDRIDYIFDRTEKTMLIIDEADFGVYRENQAIPLVDKSLQSDYILIMTGTNADRAVTHWKVDEIVSVTYPELLMQKKATQANA